MSGKEGVPGRREAQYRMSDKQDLKTVSEADKSANESSMHLVKQESEVDAGQIELAINVDGDYKEQEDEYYDEEEE